MTCFLRLGCVTLAVMVSQGPSTRAAQGVEQTPIPSSARPGVTMAVYTQGFAAANKDRLLAVNVSTTDLAGGSSKELAAVLTFRDRPSPGKIMDSQHVGGTLRIDRDVLADGDADTGLDKLGYATNEVDEAFAALHAEAGSQFNFSNAELARWTALRSKLQGADPRQNAAALAAVNVEYRAMLADRLRAYQHGGLPSIAAYARAAGQEARPGTELSAAFQLMMVGKSFPEFDPILIGFPTTGQERVAHEYLWFKQRIGNRPVFILAHRLMLQTTDVLAALERQIYVGAFYNAAQTVTGGRREGDDVVWFYGNRCFIDQPPGTGDRPELDMSPGEAVRELETYFKNIRQLLDQ